MKKLLALALVLISIPIFASAHPGRTDSSGCHTCRTNCSSWGLDTGEYHCHMSKGVPQPKEPVTSTKSTTGGVGVTVPAPEYKTPKKAVTPVMPAPVKKQAEVIIEEPIAPTIPAQPVKVEKSNFFKRLLSRIF